MLTVFSSERELLKIAVKIKVKSKILWTIEAQHWKPSKLLLSGKISKKNIKLNVKHFSSLPQSQRLNKLWWPWSKHLLLISFICLEEWWSQKTRIIKSSKLSSKFRHFFGGGGALECIFRGVKTLDFCESLDFQKLSRSWYFQMVSKNLPNGLEKRNGKIGEYILQFVYNIFAVLVTIW